MTIASLFAVVIQNLNLKTQFTYDWMQIREEVKIYEKHLTQSIIVPVEENTLSQYCSFFKQIWLHRGSSTGYVYRILCDILIYIFYSM
jgi:hypothetical protein